MSSSESVVSGFTKHSKEKLLNNRQPLALHIQLTALIVVVLAGAIAIFALQMVRQEADVLNSLFRAQTHALAKKMAVFSRDYFSTNDFNAAEDLVRNTQIPWNINMAILNANGQLLKTVVIGEADFDLSSLEQKVLSPPGTFRASSESRLGWYHIWEPVIGTQPMGWIRLSYNLKVSHNVTQRVWRRAVTNGLPIILGSVGLLLIFLWRPIRAIRSAAEFALRLDERKGETIDIDKSFLEVYQLGHALNQASLKLTSQERSLSVGKDRLQMVIKELESQQHALDQHAIVSVVDINGNICYVNDKFCELSGFDRESLLGENQLIQYPQDYPQEFFEQIWQTIAQGKLWHGEIQQRKSDGGSFWADTTIVPFNDHRGIPYKYYMIRTDVSRRKAAEQELTVKNQVLELLKDSLEEKVNQRTIDLKKANAELEKLNQVKSDFISIVSHELRTPLTSIKSFAEILFDDVEEMDVQTQRKYLSIIDKESDRLGRLITDVLDLQKIDAGKLVWKDEIVDLNLLIDSCSEIFSAKCSEKNLALVVLHLQQPAWVIADGDKLIQVITNLLSNAVKFTDCGEIHLSLESIPSEVQSTTNQLSGPRYCLKVSDSGIGIPEQELEEIFSRFHQVDSSQTRERGGSGLGLSICREIVEHYAGSIAMNSQVGKGSTVVVMLNGYDKERKKIGEILLEQGVVTKDQLSTALGLQS